ncbi:MAG TPA: 4'-phosphopantetheinyl transferase superfamily protein, partial [Thermomicrobiales bacterium]|nr:4'-phosphopantetheinyl transferase superfamily protein [Thermomicrobiales bacterium]
QPLVGGPWVSLVGEAPLVSISHTNGLAVALAMLPADGRRAGIDIERVRNRPEGYAEIAFDDAERSLIASAPSDAEWMLRGWCAKEAVGKSLGTGLRDGPRSLAVVGIDRASGRLEIERRGRLENHDMARSMRFIADTALHGDLVSAVTVG